MMPFVSVYIDIDMKRFRDSLFSVLPIHSYSLIITHIHRNKKNTKTAHWTTEVPFFRILISIYTQGGF